MGNTYRQRRAPLFFQNIQADAALGIHVRVVHLGFEVHFRGLERVVGGELFVLGGGSDWGAGSVDGAKRKTIIEEKPSLTLCAKKLQCSAGVPPFRSARLRRGILAFQARG
jgi:hypothetical protein